ncbi:hypothetical protein NM3147_2270, partial [Neisseria meningitidis NM3147]
SIFKPFSVSWRYQFSNSDRVCLAPAVRYGIRSVIGM